MKRKAWIFITAGISIALALVAAAKTNQRKKEPSMKQPVVLTVNSREFLMDLEENASAAAFREKLPMTFRMNELNGNEKYFDLKTDLPADASRPGNIQCGDLMLYGSSTVVLFYRNFSSSYRYTRLGKIRNPDGLREALGDGNPTVKFSAGKKTIGKRTASDGAVMQRENRNLPTRVLRKGTRINLYFGDTVIPGILNDSETARALIARLPLKQRMTRYRHDFCGVMEQPLPYREEEVHYGWLNGDIDFARDGNYFTILFDDERHSEQYGHQINIGVLDCPLSKIAELRGSFDVRIELAEVSK